MSDQTNKKESTSIDNNVPSLISAGSNSSTISSFTPILKNSNKAKTGRNGYRRNAGRSSNRYRGDKISTYNKRFKGETAELKENIFQIPAENPPPTQFKNTLEALERYCFKTYPGVDLEDLFSNMEMPVLHEPDDLAQGSTKKQKKLYNLRLKRFIDQEIDLHSSLCSLFSVIWGQCSKPMISKLESELTNVKKLKKNGRCDLLLIQIQKITMKYETNENIFITLYERLKELYNYHQKENESIHEYYQNFQTKLENIQRSGGKFAHHPILSKTMMEEDDLDDQDSNEALQQYQKKAERKSAAIAFLHQANAKIFGDLKISLKNTFTIHGIDKYPKDIPSAYSMMVRWESTNKPRQYFGNSQANSNNENSNPHNKSRATNTNNTYDARFTRKGYPGVTFAQDSNNSKKRKIVDVVAGNDGKINENFYCSKCKSMGHTYYKCPNDNTSSNSLRGNNNNASNFFQSKMSEEEVHDENDDDKEFSSVSFTQMGYAMAQSRTRYNGVKATWILLDTQSNCDIFRNPEYLTNIKKHDKKELTILSNGGSMTVNKTGYLRNYGEVWFERNSMANILSMSNVRKKFRVTMDIGPSTITPTIWVHIDENTKIDFTEHDMGLFVHDMTKPNKNHVFLNTVQSNRNLFNKREVHRAKLAQDLFKKIGRPGYKTFPHILDKGLIRDCPMTSDDIKRAMTIFGLDPAVIKGKSTRKKPNSVTTTPHTSVPNHIQKWHSKVNL